MEVFLSLFRLNEIDFNDMNNFLKTSTVFLNENVCRLCEQVQNLVQVYEDLLAMNISPHDKNDNKNDNTIGEIDSQSSIIASLMYI